MTADLLAAPRQERRRHGRGVRSARGRPLGACPDQVGVDLVGGGGEHAGDEGLVDDHPAQLFDAARQGLAGDHALHHDLGRHHVDLAGHAGQGAGHPLVEHRRRHAFLEGLLADERLDDPSLHPGLERHADQGHRRGHGGVLGRGAEVERAALAQRDLAGLLGEVLGARVGPGDARGPPDAADRPGGERGGDGSDELDPTEPLDDVLGPAGDPVLVPGELVGDGRELVVGLAEQRDGQLELALLQELGARLERVVVGRVPVGDVGHVGVALAAPFAPLPDEGQAAAVLLVHLEPVLEVGIDLVADGLELVDQLAQLHDHRTVAHPVAVLGREDPAQRIGGDHSVGRQHLLGGAQVLDEGVDQAERDAAGEQSLDGPQPERLLRLHVEVDLHDVGVEETPGLDAQDPSGRPRRGQGSVGPAPPRLVGVLLHQG